MDVNVNRPVSNEELIPLAMRLREELFRYEDKLGSSRDFAQLMCSASALIVAILEPVEFRLSASSPRKTAQLYSFPARKPFIPSSLH